MNHLRDGYDHFPVKMKILVNIAYLEFISLLIHWQRPNLQHDGIYYTGIKMIMLRPGIPERQKK